MGNHLTTATISIFENKSSQLKCILTAPGRQVEQLLGEGRVYGGGLYKLEPKELANVPATEVAELLPSLPKRFQQSELFVAAE